MRIFKIVPSKSNYGTVWIRCWRCKFKWTMEVFRKVRFVTFTLPTWICPKCGEYN